MDEDADRATVLRALASDRDRGFGALEAGGKWDASVLERLRALAEAEERRADAAEELLLAGGDAGAGAAGAAAEAEDQSNKRNVGNGDDRAEGTNLETLRAHVAALEADALELQRRLDALKADDARLRAEEEKLAMLRERTALALCVESERLAGERTRLATQSPRFDSLEGASALNEAFHVWREGPFGTINGLRLGSLPDVPVDWSEINAALGFAAALVVSIANEVGMPNFRVWRFELRGSSTRLVRLTGSHAESVPLHCSGGFWKTDFNAALCAFAACVAELAEFAQALDPTVVLPFPILAKLNLVGGLSVQYYSASQPDWTHAMKLLLIDIKWLEAWRAKRGREPRPRGGASSSALS